MKDSDNATLEISTPKGPFKGTFPKSTEVSTVIEFVVKELGLKGADQYELYFKGNRLVPEKNTLAEFEIFGVVELELVAQGDGV